MGSYEDYMELKRYFMGWMQDGVQMSQEIKRLYWRELKKMERSTRCRTENGVRCRMDCGHCSCQRSGMPLSLDAMLESGKQPADTFSAENDILQRELWEALHQAIASLGETDRNIILLWGENATERQIGTAVGLSQKGVNKRVHKILSVLREALKDYR